MAVSFIDGGNRSTWRKPTLSHTVISSTPRHLRSVLDGHGRIIIITNSNKRKMTTTITKIENKTTNN